MATAVVLPQLGNTVETTILVEWKKQPGELVAAGEVVCEVETDKAVMEVESPVAGTLLAHFFTEGDDVPVLTNIAAVGEPGEEFSHLQPDGTGAAPLPESHAVSGDEGSGEKMGERVLSSAISPRARNLAERKGVDVSAVVGSGPSGRVIERDIIEAAGAQPRLSPVAKAMVEQSGYQAPVQGSGPRGQVMIRDLAPPAGAASGAPAAHAETSPRVAEEIPVKGVRRVIADRMLNSLQTTAQLTLHTTADARALLAYRRRLKAEGADVGLDQVTINDLVLFVVSRVLPNHPNLNARFTENTITRYHHVDLGFAVDTERGLIVPVIPDAQALSLATLGRETRRLAGACQDGTITPDEMAGGTFTVTNLGHLGIESFTPILNAPQVAILGVGNTNLRPVDVEGEVEFHPHIGLSLTINHQVVDGAPAARFLQDLARGITKIDLLVAA